MQARIASVASTHPGMTIVSATNLGANQNTSSGVQIPSSPSRPSILRRREGEREIIGKSDYDLMLSHCILKTLLSEALDNIILLFLN